MSGAYYLGVDGGQSSTLSLIGDSAGRVVGKGRGGPCNHVGAAEGREKFLHALHSSLGAALRDAGLEAAATVFRCAVLGFSGGPKDKEALTREVVQAEDIWVVDDAVIALSGALGGHPGAIVIAGTGSIALARDSSGALRRAGGWGYVYGDEGSAFDISRRALKAALRFEEGWGPATALRAKLLEASSAENANDLLHRLYTAEFSRAQVAGWARLVDVCADEGDAAALQILEESASELGRLASAVTREMVVEDGVPVAQIGGVFQSRRLRAMFEDVTSQAGMRPMPALLGPAGGALIEAYRRCGLQTVLQGAPNEKTG